MRHFVDEGLKDEGERIVPGRPQRPGGDAKRNQRIAIRKVRHAAGRISVRIEVGRARERAVAAETDEMLLPGDKPAGLVQTAFKEVPAGRPIKIVLHVVGAVPEQLDRCAGGPRNPRRLDHVIVHQPPAEAATVAGGFRYAQRMGRKRFLPAEQSERNALMGVDMPLRSRVRHFAWR